MKIKEIHWNDFGGVPTGMSGSSHESVALITFSKLIVCTVVEV